MIELVIFDCDGVLVDSELLASRVKADQLQALGIAMSADEVTQALVGLDSVAARQLLEARHGVPVPADFDARYNELLEAAFRLELQPIAGVHHLLSRLEQPYCVASNSSHPRLVHTFASTGLTRAVAGRVFSADDVARGKPAPDLFLHAAAAMGGVPPDRCLVIEDSVTGVAAARAAGGAVAAAA